MNVYAAQHNTLLLHFCKLLLVLHMNVFMYIGPTATPRAVASISSQSGGGAADEVEGILHPFHSPPVHSMEYSLQVTVILAPYSEHTHTRITNNVTNSPNEQQQRHKNRLWVAVLLPRENPYIFNTCLFPLCHCSVFTPTIHPF